MTRSPSVVSETGYFIGASRDIRATAVSTGTATIVVTDWSGRRGSGPRWVNSRRTGVETSVLAYPSTDNRELLADVSRVHHG